MNVVEQLQSIRGEITIVKNLISTLRAILGGNFKIEYEKDEEGNNKLDEEGNPIINEEGLGKVLKLISDTLKKHLAVEILKNEEGVPILDEHKNTILDTKTSGDVSKLIVSELEKYFNLHYESDSDGNIIYDENNNPKIIEETLGIIIDYIYKQLNIRFNIEEGEIPKYINSSLDKRFSINSEIGLGSVITYLQLAFERIQNSLDALEGISEKIDGIVTSLEVLPTIKDDANDAAVFSWAMYRDYDTLLSDASKTNDIYSLLNTIKTIIDRIDTNTKPSS